MRAARRSDVLIEFGMERRKRTEASLGIEEREAASKEVTVWWLREWEEASCCSSAWYSTFSAIR